MSAGKFEKKPEKKHSFLFYLIISITSVLIVLLLFAILFVRVDIRTSIVDRKTMESNTEESKGYANSKGNTESKNTAEDIIAQCVAQVKKNVPEAYKGYVVLDAENGDHILVISVCYDGFYDAYSMNSSDWRELTDAVDGLTDSAHNLFLKAGHSNWSVSIMLHNDKNYDRILYTAMNGQEYDVTITDEVVERSDGDAKKTGPENEVELLAYNSFIGLYNAMKNPDSLKIYDVAAMTSRAGNAVCIRFSGENALGGTVTGYVMSNSGKLAEALGIKFLEKSDASYMNELKSSDDYYHIDIAEVVAWTGLPIKY